MAAITVDATAVFKSAAGSVEDVTLGATLVAGDVVYKDATASYVVKKVDAAAAASAICAGIMLNSGVAGQPGRMCTFDSELTTDAVWVAGKVYVVSTTAGKLIEDSEMVAGYLTVCAVATSTTKIQFSPSASGVLRA